MEVILPQSRSNNNTGNTGNTDNTGNTGNTGDTGNTGNTGNTPHGMLLPRGHFLVDAGRHDLVPMGQGLQLGLDPVYNSTLGHLYGGANLPPGVNLIRITPTYHLPIGTYVRQFRNVSF